MSDGAGMCYDPKPIESITIKGGRRNGKDHSDEIERSSGDRTRMVHYKMIGLLLLSCLVAYASAECSKYLIC